MTADNDAGNTMYWELRWHTALASDMVQYQYHVLGSEVVHCTGN